MACFSLRCLVGIVLVMCAGYLLSRADNLLGNTLQFQEMSFSEQTSQTKVARAINSEVNADAAKAVMAPPEATSSLLRGASSEGMAPEATAKTSAPPPLPAAKVPVTVPQPAAAAVPPETVIPSSSFSPPSPPAAPTPAPAVLGAKTSQSSSFSSLPPSAAPAPAVPGATTSLFSSFWSVSPSAAPAPAPAPTAPVATTSPRPALAELTKRITEYPGKRCGIPRNMQAFTSQNWGDFALAVFEDPKPFGWVRYGDGEWMCVLGQKFSNADGLNAHSDMCHHLKEVTLQPQPSGMYMLMSHHLCAFTGQLALMTANLGKWYAFFGMMDLLGQPKFGEMLEALRRRGRTVLVGPLFLGRLHHLFGHSAHITVSSKACHSSLDAWSGRQQIQRRIREESAKAGVNVGVTFLVAAGMAANVFIHNMFRELKKDSFIDIGSSFDGWAGHPSRDYNNYKSRNFQVGSGLNLTNTTDVDHVGCRL